jgi:sulfur relay (sulfurtransferase) DsrF/TusC family protein
MARFHVLCFNATSSMMVLKRRPHGLTLGREDLGALLRQQALIVQAALKDIGQGQWNLVAHVEYLEKIGVDMECTSSRVEPAIS